MIIRSNREFTRSLHNLLRHDGRREIHVIKNPCLFLHNYGKILSIPRCLPNEIIQGKLYLGNEKNARNSDIIHELGITHIVNATQSVPNAFENIEYISCRIEDADDS